MRAIRLDNVLRPNRVYRVVALFFLVFTFIDLACPGICRDDFDDLGTQIPAQIAAKTIVQSYAPDAGQQERRDSRPQPLEEDCFCCCPHILPTYQIESPVLTAKLPQHPAPAASLPNAPPGGTYHPPRSASC